MLLLNDKILTMPVVSLQTGRKLATLAKAIVDPRQLHVIAYYCEGPNLDIDPAVLHTDDIREVSSMGMIVDSAEDIMSPEDLVRLQQIIDFDFNLVGMKVIDDSGKKIGKVSSYSIETNTFFIIKIHVQPGFFQALHTTEHIIDRSQIIEINDNAIVVKSASVKEGALGARHIIDSSFRGRPQPDVAHNQE
ncbi:MAG TPA: PRC-barrel domain-containing protein [Candidatus Saccharimonadales bacterium]|nr:PRC-barrel domain-containing protein [Candidatus Saccharimonadales bacterium]